jgi:hypothetical protein
MQESTNPKNTVIPGYAGYIPTIKAENVHARGFSAMAKQSFQNEKLGRNPFGLSSTGFNLDKGALIDRSKVASSSKYGKTEIQRAHPGWNVNFISYRPTGKLLLKILLSLLRLFWTQLIDQLIRIFKLVQKAVDTQLTILTWTEKDGSQTLF